MIMLKETIFINELRVMFVGNFDCWRSLVVRKGEFALKMHVITWLKDEPILMIVQVIM